jgi:TolA-binding protein
VGQSIEIPFRGNGWVYLGEQENRQGMVYHSRRNELDGQKYVFRADSVGTYTLKFYRQDFIEDYIINEYVQVIVSENPVIAGTNRTQPVERDRAESGSSRAETAGSSQAAAQDSIAGAASSVARADYLQQAKDAYTAGSFPEVITLLDQFRELYPAGTDEAWWLYAQSFEANSPSRNIRSALDYYRRLIQEYPQSPRGSEAQRRIAYLERYYFNIR